MTRMVSAHQALSIQRTYDLYSQHWRDISIPLKGVLNWHDFCLIKMFILEFETGESMARTSSKHCTAKRNRLL
jgi:hypothetical protein